MALRRIGLDILIPKLRTESANNGAHPVLEPRLSDRKSVV